MKKIKILLITVVILVIIIIVVNLLNGCDGNPASFFKWTKHHEGTIKNIDYQDYGYSSHYNDVQITFENGSVYWMDRLYYEKERKETLKIGEYGVLYIKTFYLDRSVSGQQLGDYKWVRSSQPIKEITITPKETINKRDNSYF